MAEILDGKKVADAIVEECKSEVGRLSLCGITKTLAVILVGNDPASAIYVNNKKKKCEYIGIYSKTYELPEREESPEWEELPGQKELPRQRERLQKK